MEIFHGKGGAKGVVARRKANYKKEHGLDDGDTTPEEFDKDDSDYDYTDSEDDEEDDDSD